MATTQSGPSTGPMGPPMRETHVRHGKGEADAPAGKEAHRPADPASSPSAPPAAAAPAEPSSSAPPAAAAPAKPPSSAPPAAAAPAEPSPSAPPAAAAPAKPSSSAPPPAGPSSSAPPPAAAAPVPTPAATAAPPRAPADEEDENVGEENRGAAAASAPPQPRAQMPFSDDEEEDTEEEEAMAASVDQQQQQQQQDDDDDDMVGKPIYHKSLGEHWEYLGRYYSAMAPEARGAARPDVLLLHLNLGQDQLGMLVRNISGVKAPLLQGPYLFDASSEVMRCRVFGRGLQQASSRRDLQFFLRQLKQKKHSFNMIAIAVGPGNLDRNSASTLIAEVFSEAASEELIVMGIVSHARASHYEDACAIDQADFLRVQGCTTVHFLSALALERPIPLEPEQLTEASDSDRLCFSGLNIIRCTAFAIGASKAPPAVPPVASEVLDDNAKCDAIEIAIKAGFDMSDEDMEAFEEHLAMHPGDLTVQLLSWLQDTGRSRKQAGKQLAVVKAELERLDSLIQAYAKATGLDPIS